MNLDDLSEIQKLDTKQVAASIASFPDQIEDAWENSRKTNFPADFSQAKNIVLAGMGGSALGADLIASVFKNRLPVPFVIVRDYNLPAFVDQDSLVILSTYSGTTEEILSVAEESRKIGCKMIGITEGKDLGEFMEANSVPGYIFEPKFNPSNQPRLGLGYTAGGILGMLSKMDFLKLGEPEITEIAAYLKETNSKLLPSVQGNQAKTMANSIVEKQIILVAGEFLSGNAHIFANQMNENAKNFAAYFLLSELNHHLLEGLGHPKNLSGQTKILFLNSALYSSKTAKRISITREVMEKQGFETITLDLAGKTELTQSFEAIVYSSWVTFYLGILYGVDPSQIPWVDYFKEQLAKN